MGKAIKAAIIGAGSAGTFAAYELHKRLGNHVNLTVYERNEHAGGRAWTIDFAGERVEVGGVLLHSSGKYGYELMEFAGCKEGVPGVSVDGADETYAFWTNQGFPVFTKTSLPSMAVGILKHVGPKSALSVTNAAMQMSHQWESIYDLQERGARYRTPEDMLDAMGLLSATRQDLHAFLKAKGANERMAKDIVEPIIHNMYNQGLELNAFAGLVGLAGAGLAGGHLFAVEGGNWTLFQRALEKMGVDARFGAKVTRVNILEREGSLPRFSVTANGIAEEYDTVIIAAPPALSGISVTRDDAELPIARNPYQPVHTTIVVGDLDPSYFGCTAGAKLPSTIFVADSANAPFKSVGVTGYSSAHHRRMYKIFSAEHRMTEAELSAIFTDVVDAHEHVWAGAYPVLGTNVQHVPFELQPGLYFANAFETAAGSIEVEAVGGVNAANLAGDYLTDAAFRAWGHNA